MKRKIFISHASKDTEIVNEFIDSILRLGLSVDINDIFCTGTDGTKIKSGDDWRESIKHHLQSASINFLIISPNYKESEVCMNEMGAAWISDAKVIPLIIEPINYKTVGILQEPIQIEKLLEETSLDNIRDIIQTTLEISATSIPTVTWNTAKKKFINVISNYITQNPFSFPIDTEKDDLKNKLKTLTQHKQQLENQIKELAKIKDKQEVDEVLKHYRNENTLDEFKKLCVNVTKCLYYMSPIIVGIIYKSYSGKDIIINTFGYRDDLSEAFSRDFIDENNQPDWNKTKQMKALKQALDKVSEFIKKIDFLELYEEEYDAPLDISNMSFWEEAFDRTVTIN